jgi:hypothetical protein
MRGVLVLCLAALALIGASVSAAAQAPDAVRSCHVFVHYPNTLISSARNMTCRAAARELRRYRGSIHRRFRTPGGFLCGRVSGGRLGGQWRCVQGSRAFRFEFGD